MSSNIPAARDIIASVLHGNKDLSRSVRMQLRTALELMVRDAPVKRAVPTRTEITEEMRRRIHDLARQNVPLHRIANIVKLRNSGRVSEILNGKR